MQTGWDAKAIEAEAKRLFDAQVEARNRWTDRFFALLLLLQWAAAQAMAFLVSPRAWAGLSTPLEVHVWLAYLAGGAIVSVPTALAIFRPGKPTTRHAVAVGQMLMGSLLIHLSGGRIETHFHVFGSLAFLALYRDWRVLVTASTVMAADNYFRGVYWPQSVFGTSVLNPLRWVEHTAWVLFEDVVLVYGILQSHREMREIARRQAEGEALRALVEQEVQVRTAEIRWANAELGQEVIERQRVVEELRQGESTIRSFFDSAPALMGVVELAGDDIRFVSANAATAAVFSLPPDAFSGRLAGEFRVSRFIRSEWVARCKESEASGRPVRFEISFRATVGGGARYLAATVCLIAVAKGCDPRFAFVIEEVTSRKRAEAAQSAQHAATRILAGSAPLNEAISRLLREVGECLGMDAGDYWELDAEAGLLRPAGDGWRRNPSRPFPVAEAEPCSGGEGLPGRVWVSGQPERIEGLSRARRADRPSGAASPALNWAFGFPVASDAGPVGVITFARRRPLAPGEPPAEVLTTLGRQIGLFVARRRAEDALRRAHDDLECRVLARTAELDAANACLLAEVAERRRAERGLRASESRFRTLTEAMPQLVWTASPDGNWDYLSRQWAEYSGDTESGPSETGWLGTLHPDDRERCRSCWADAVGGGGRYDVESRIRARDGKYRWFKIRGLAVRDAAGRVVQWLGTCTDIDDQKCSEEALLRAHEELEDRVRARTAELGASNAALKDEAAERGRAEREALERQHFIENIAEANPSILYVFDVIERRTVWINRRVTDVLGYTPDRFGGTGKTLLEMMVHPDDEARLGLSGRTTRYDGLADGQVLELEFRVRHEDGSWRWLRSRELVFHRDPEGRPVRVLGAAEDVTDRRAVEESLRRAKEAAEAATRAKSEFLANMSHEIRTPMNGIIGMTELALDTDLNPRQREYLDVVKSSAESLLTVINDILDFSKIEAGKLALEPVRFALRDCLVETIRSLAVRAQGKGLELACRIAPEVPDVLVGDPDRLRQVVVNLVGNALKFTQHGEVIVNVGRCEADAGPGTELLEFTVSDTGIGIPANKLSSIFEPFEQADGSTTRRYGGTGLGLAIASRLAVLMGGRLWAESELGRGSTFRFTARFDRPEVSTTRDGADDDSGLRDLAVLVVDDHAASLQILEEILSGWGARPASAGNGESALQALRDAAEHGKPFGVVLIDGTTSATGALDLSAMIRSQRSNAVAGVAILLLTGTGGPDDPGRCADLGVSACLTKPVRPSQLFDALVGSVRELPGGALADGPAQPGEGDVRAADDSENPPLNVLVAEDHPVNQKVVLHMIAKMRHHVTVVADGLEALGAIDRGEYDLVLMDLQMPVMDGFEAVRAVRERERGRKTGRRVPIVALTAHAMKGDRERCLAAGFDGYLAKPVRESELRAAVRAFGRRAPAEAAPPTAEDDDVVRTPAPDDALIARLIAQCGNDTGFAQELAGSFLQSAPSSVEALALAIEEGEMTRLAAEAHRLKGACLAVGGGKLAEACKLLEDAARQGDLASARAASGPFRDAWERVKSTFESYAGVPT